MKRIRSETDKTSYELRNRLRDTAIAYLLLFTGIRVSECVGVNISDIDLDKCTVNVFRKRGKIETVHFNQDTRDAIADYINFEREASEDDPDALFVSRKRNRISVDAIEKMIKKYSSGITAKHITPHKLRSTYATNLYIDSSDVYMVMDALGHSTISTVQRYISSSERNRERAANMINYNNPETGE